MSSNHGICVKQYCQPTFRYCLENIKIPCKKLNELDVRQNNGNNKSFINQILAIEKELKIEIEEYDFSVIIPLIELNANITEKETLNEANQIIFYIKLYIKTKREYFFLYKKLSEVLNYCKKNSNNNNT